MPTSPPTDLALIYRREGKRPRWVRDYRAERRARLQSSPAQQRAMRLRSSGRWQQVREQVLRAQPLCADPHGVHKMTKRAAFATEVDHIIPLVDDPGGALDLANLQGLCETCHRRKSGDERRARQRVGRHADRG